MKRLVAVLLLMTSSVAVGDSTLPPAPLANAQLPDPRQEAAARALMLSIRCLVCQGQSVIDSNAELAGDMRALIRTRIQRGERPDAIRAWLIDRYGSWVSYQPTVTAETLPLWLAPLLLLLIGGWLARGRFRRRAR